MLEYFLWRVFSDCQSIGGIDSLPTAGTTTPQVVQSRESPNYPYQPSYENIEENWNSTDSSAELGAGRDTGSGGLTNRRNANADPTKHTENCTETCTSAPACFFAEFRSKSYSILKMFLHLNRHVFSQSSKPKYPPSW